MKICIFVLPWEILFLLILFLTSIDKLDMICVFVRLDKAVKVWTMPKEFEVAQFVSWGEPSHFDDEKHILTVIWSVQKCQLFFLGLRASLNLEV